VDAWSKKRMSALPLASYLVEFGSDRADTLAQASRGPRNRGDAAVKIQEAYAQGLEAGKVAGLALMEAKLDEERASLSRQLASERQAWVAREADTLAARLAAGLQDLEARIADSAARALAPILHRDFCDRAIADLRAELDVLLTKDPELRISVTGPEDLLQSLRERLTGKDCTVTYSVGAEPDLRISAGETVLETRIAAWAAKVAEAVR
jgi:hypothetical protein